ncbi:MAG TPA: ABC transporter ATP-binding protein [Capillimicrobium sp.]|nr:ABC transporter ATP-binding protein [Capillimicrobium sp.]
MSTPMIRLEHLEKRFPGQARPAVEDLTLDIARGEIVVLVGPSGCGKSTTLRLINRLIEPTGGRIEIDGRDVTHADPDELRRHIGYVIQQIGLFPHMTVAENVATVPEMLGWDRSRIRARVDELLTTVGMPPDEYRDRYPKELSGGQSQRVGVARAMAADPPVLLMDEPFGAIDPITRVRLQDEFLRLQAQMAKTVVFVTHDIDEAIKMGDRIVLLREGAHIAQYDTPERLLTAPADQFVADFIGAGPLVRGLTLARIADAELVTWPVVDATADRDRALAALREGGRDALVVLDGGRPARWVGADDLRNGRPLSEAGAPIRRVLTPDVTLHDALDELIGSGTGAAAVVDEHGAYQGVVELRTLTDAVAAMRNER